MTQLPRIHMNGSSPRELARQYGEGIKALAQAIDMIRHIEVHGRDYYVINSSAASVAIREHGERLASLEAVHNQLLRIHSSIIEQMSDRR